MRTLNQKLYLAEQRAVKALTKARTNAKDAREAAKANLERAKYALSLKRT